MTRQLINRLAIGDVATAPGGRTAHSSTVERRTVGDVAETEVAIATHRRWPQRLFALLLAIVSATAIVNPWRFAILDTQWQVGLLAVTIATVIWACQPRQLQGWRAAVYWLLATAGVLEILGLAAGVFISRIFMRDLNRQSVRIDPDHRIVVRDFHYGLGPDSACRQLELRSGNGVLERRRTIGQCAQLKYVDRWTVTSIDGELVINTGTRTCSYLMGDGLGPITTIDDDACHDLLGALR
jgi:hypothetical protein